MICNFDGWARNYLTTLETLWTSMHNCFRSVNHFPRKTCSKTYSVVLVSCLWSLFLTYLMFMKLYSQYWGWVKMVDIALKFLGNIKDWCLFFSLLVRLIWLCETTKLSNSVLSNCKRITQYQPCLHWCMGANHTLRNAFSIDLDFSKSKILPSAKLWWGLE